MSSYQKPLLLFDSECSMCKRFAEGLRRLDTENTLSFESIHNEDIYQVFPDLKKEKCQKDIHLILENKTLVGTDVTAFLADSIPASKKISWLLGKEASKNALGLFYKQISRIRQFKKNCRHCG